MKTKLLVNLFGLLTLAVLATGCVIHEHGHSRSRPRHHPPPQFHAHVHGDGCGHVLRGGIWIAIP